MKEKTESTEVGVIVGRFQVPHLHEAHLDLIRSVRERHPVTLIVLGIAPVLVTRNNPLDFESRKQMLLEAFPDVTVLLLKDVASDEEWSRRLDEILGDAYPTAGFTLYGGRASFLECYSGRHRAVELAREHESAVSGTDLRREVSARAKGTADFRAGVVFAAFNQYAKCFPTVDVAIFSEDGTKILLARKPHEKLFRFFGGFADPGSTSYEADARREVMEECGVEISAPQYLGSTLIDDWRYRAEVDKIKTLFFSATYVSGRAEANDDIAEVRWFDAATLGQDDVVPTHHPLLSLLRRAHPAG